MSCKQWVVIVGVGVLSLTLILVATGYGEPGGPRVQVFEEYLEPGEFHVYDLPNLQKGETLSVYMQRISGTLDPYIGVSQPDFDYKAFEIFSKALRQEVREAEW